MARESWSSRHQDDRPAQHLAEDHFLDFRRLQGVGDQHLHVVAPADDVDAFAAEFVDDVLDAVSAHAHAGADAVDALVGAADGDLGAVAGLAGDGADLDHALGDFRDFLLEEALHQVRLGAAEDDLDAAARLADLVDGRPHALVGVVRFAGDLLAAGEDGLDVGQGDRGGAAFVALDHAGDQLPLEFLVFGVEGVAFGLADLLDHHLLGGLGADALGHFFRRQGDAVVRSGDGAVLAIDGDLDVFLFAVVFFGGGDQRRFDALEDDLLVDVLVAVDRVNDPKQFAGIHRFSLPRSGQYCLAPLGPDNAPKRSKIL